MESLKAVFPLNSTWLKSTEESSVDKQHLSSVVTLASSSQHGSVNSSLLFQAVVSHSLEENHVALITAAPLRKLPSRVHGMPAPDPSLMKSMKILYMSNMTELIAYLSDMHKQAVLPCALAVENIDAYVSHIQGEAEKMHSLAKLFALLKDVSYFLSCKSVTGRVYVTCCDKQLLLQVAVKFSRVFLLAASPQEEEFQVIPYCKHKTADWMIRFHQTKECIKLVEILERKQDSKDQVTFQ